MMIFFRRLIKWIWRGLLLLLLLIVVMAVALQFPAVQTRMAAYVTAQLSARTGTEVTVSRVGIRLPRSVTLKEVFVEDMQADTLLYAGALHIDVHLGGLLRNHVQIRALNLRDATVYMCRLEPDTLFNYDQLIRAMGNDTGGEAAVENDVAMPGRHASNGNYEETAPLVEPTEETQDASTWTFDVGALRLDNIRFRYADHFSGLDIQLQLEHIHTSVDVLDLAEARYALGQIRLSGGHVHYHAHERGRPPPEPIDEPGIPPDVALAKLQLEQVGFLYTQAGDSVFEIDMDHILLTPGDLDLREMRFAVNALSADIPLTAVAGMRFHDVQLDMADALYGPDTLSADLRHLALSKDDEFQVKRFSAALHSGRHTKISNLNLETRESLIEADLFAGLPLLGTMDLSANVPIDVDIRKAMAGSDLGHFLPEPEMLFPDQESPPLDLVMRVTGQLGDMRLDTLQLAMAERLSIRTAGQIKGYPDMESLGFDLPQIHVSALPPHLMDYVPEENRPQGLTLPPETDIWASLSGKLQDFHGTLELVSDFFDADASFSYKEKEEKHPEWQGNVQITGNQPLSVVGQDELLQDLSAMLYAKGKGFDPESMDLELDLHVDSLWFNDYTYRSLSLLVNAAEGLFQTALRYDDEHLVLDMETDILLRGEQPELSFNWALDHLNANALQLADEMIALQTRLEGSFTFKKPQFPDGWLYVHDTYVLLDRDVYRLDSLHLNTNTNDAYYFAEIYAPMLEGRYQGNMSPAAIPAALADHAMTYLGMERDPQDGYIYVEDPEMPAQHFEFFLRIRPSPYFHELLFPQISSFDPISMQARFNSTDRLLAMEATMPEMIFGGWHIKDLNLEASSDAEMLDFSFGIPKLSSDALTIKGFHTSGSLRDQMLDFHLAFSDMQDQSWLDLAGSLSQEADHTELKLDTAITVNRERWQVDPGNYLRIFAHEIQARDMRIYQQDKEIAISSTEGDGEASPLRLSLQQIDMGKFDLLGGEALVQGVIDGHLIIHDLYDDLAFTADLYVDDLGYGGDAIGDVSLLVFSPVPGFYQVDASVSGYGNRIDLAGTYHQAEEDFMDFELRLENLELATLEALTLEQLSDMEGQISGALRLSGSPTNPDMDGAVNFDQVGFHAAFLNARYTIPEETIIFDKHNVRFSSFTLLDRSERPASLDGTISMHDISDISFDLSLTSSNFLLLDISRDDNDLFYGRLLIDTDLNMSGDMVRPVIEGRLKLNQGSSFTFIPPQYLPEAIGDEGVVEFMAVYEDVFTDLALRPEEIEPMQSAFENLDISVNVEIDPATDVRILIDEVAGDILEIQGGGLITYGVDPGGRISLAGRYEITRGAYQMTFYDVIRRNFDIERGSQITWTGDPLDASVDITAKYTVRTSSRELMASHGPAAGQHESAFRQIYPFEVFLRMEGDLMSPEISFEVGLPPEHRGAMEGRLQARLTELNESESELNKQVFALLIIGNFIQDDPIAAVTAGPGITSTARSSASRLLSQQLNRLSDRYIRGVDISFDLESYEQVEDGQMVGRTELQMEVSRDFLDQRLRITAGGHLELEDETRRQINPADMAGDFSVEYLLDPDGRFTLKGYRERKFQDVFDGEVIETGVSFIFRQTFDHFGELLRRKEEEEEEE